MKKLFLYVLLAVMTCGTASAQSWLDMLKKIGTEAADKATDGKLTQYALAGTWNYASPGAKFEGNDLLSTLGGSALEEAAKQQLDRYYQMVGLKPGVGTLVFTKDETFTAKLGSYELSGTYSFDAATHVATMQFTKDKLTLMTIPGNVYLEGSNLSLVFPINKLVELVKTYGSKISSMENVIALLEQYENVYVGFEFTKAN